MSTKKKTNKGPFDGLLDIYNKSVEKEDKKGFAIHFKNATETIFAELKKELSEDSYKNYKLKTLTITDLKYLDGYFIFGKGTNSVVHFHIKELPGWLFAFWWDRVEQSRDNSKCRVVKGEFFTQYEENIDKFKPSRSEILKEVTVYLTEDNKYEYCAFAIADTLNFMYKQPYLAFCRDYLNWDYNVEYHTPEEAKKEFLEFKRQQATDRKYKKICDTRILNFMKNQVYKKFLDNGSCIITDHGDCVSPRYEFIFDKSKIDEFKNDKPGCYHINQMLTKKTSNAIRAKEKELDKLAYKNNVCWFSPAAVDFLYVCEHKDFESCKKYKLKEAK